jgi:hypothetical protein
MLPTAYSERLLDLGWDFNENGVSGKYMENKETYVCPFILWAFRDLLDMKQGC